MDKRELLELHLAELKKRNPRFREKHDFTDYNFKRQAEILADNSRFQAWLFTRRFGKSTAFAKKACGVAANIPGSKVLYLALTLPSAKGILWNPIEQELNQKNIKFSTNQTQGEYHLDSGSLIKFFGVDSNYKEMKKILGQGYHLVGIDECGSMTIDMEQLVLQMILAALSDFQGTLVLLGTAENIPNTFYQSVTDGKERSLPWVVHKGSTLDSPYTGKQFRSDMDLILAGNPNAIKTSWFRTHWLNEWCADDDLLIIKFNKELNRVDKLPDYKDWIFGLGVDLGYNDATSFTVDAMSSKSPYLYRIKSFKSPGLDFTGVAQVVRQLNAEYGFTFAEVDGANKQGVQEMQNRHDLGLMLKPAEKSDKATYLRLMGDDYKEGKIKHVGDGCLSLEDEQSKLMWIKDSDKEDPRCQNHCNDGALYIWRKMRNYFKPEVTPWKSQEQKMEDQHQEEARRAIEERDELSLLF